jgi:hypothetical protein
MKIAPQQAMDEDLHGGDNGGRRKKKTKEAMRHF